MGRRQGQGQDTGAEVRTKAGCPGFCHPSVSWTWEGQQQERVRGAGS